MSNHEPTTRELAEKLDELMAFLQEHVATKEDLKAYATKEDLTALATREDLLETKNELRREIATFKFDVIDRMDAKLLELENRLIRRFSPLVT